MQCCALNSTLNFPLSQQLRRLNSFEPLRRKGRDLKVGLRLAFPGASLSICVLLSFYLTVSHVLPLELLPALLNVKRDLFSERGSSYLCPRMEISKTLRKGARREIRMLQIHFKRLFQWTLLGHVLIKYV